MNAPFIEPMPPITMTTNATMMIWLPMPIDASVIGAIIIPARPASTAPMTNTIENSKPILIPRALIMVRFEAPARMRIPNRVRVTRTNRPNATARPVMMIAIR